MNLPDSVLGRIHSPADLKVLSDPELEQLAVEMRSELIDVLGRRSAHFASNLGVVELCLALHLTFDFRRDRLIWDTGHQIYPHKLITGRYSQFDTRIFSPPNISRPAGGNANGNVTVRTKQAVVGTVWTINPSSVLEARLGVDYTEAGKNPSTLGQSNPGFVIPNLPNDPSLAGGLFSLNLSGISQLGRQSSNPQYQDPFILDPKVNFTKLIRRHSLKAGFEYQLIDTAVSDFHRRRAVAVTLGATAGLAALLVAVPMPYHSHAEGVIWLSEQAMVRAGANGFVDRLLVEPGTRVTEGEPLVRSFDPMLDARLRLAQARVAELEAQYASEFVADRAKAEIAREKLESERAALALASEKASDLIVHARSDGVFIAPQALDMPGRYYRKGELLGYVIGKEQPLARVVVPQEAVDMVRLATDRVRVRLVDRPEVIAEGRVVRQVPAGEAYLPSRALATEGGGEIATDPRETKGPKALERMFQFDVALAGIPRLETFGARAYVRFDHRMEPLCLRWYRGVRLLFLSRFGV